jgi:hypothetical protein
MLQVELVSAAERPQDDVAEPPFHRWTLPGGALWTSFWRVESGYLVRFPGLADFEISSDGRRVHAWRAPGVPVSTADHLYLNQAIPLALSRQGALVLHAGAVELDGHCVAFLGPSGRGKSTLTASFATSGHRFLTDDGLQLTIREGRLLALPNHPSIRLWADSHQAVMPHHATSAEPVDYTSKARFLADAALRHCPAPRPVHSLFFLGARDCEQVRIEPVRPQTALVELVRHSFLLDIDERRMLAAHFDEISRIANLGGLYHLDYPRRYDMLSKVRGAIIDHAQECAAP